MAKGGGGGKLLLLCVLGLALGALGWNYARNTAAEEAGFRPYKSYSLDDLEALIGAYDADVETFQQRYTTASNSRTTAAHRESLDGRVREFERVQKTGRAKRELGAQLAEKQAALKLLRAELERRNGASEGIPLFLQRAFVYRP